MRKKIVAGNWKMNNVYSEAKSLMAELLDFTYDKDVELIVIPPAIYLNELVKKSSESDILIGAQNCSEQEKGAYTGEVSSSMLKSVGVKYVLVGHSERRTYQKETNSLLADKVNQAIANDIIPIYCCGEILEEREAENHFNVIKKQISKGLFHLTGEQIENCIIAYEPVWAIGTGVTATSDQAQEMHAFIRNVLEENYSTEIAESISILYGGSCKPSNAKELFAKKDVDGGLIGGASLVAEDFISIANSF